jgi:hypothetical protein
MVFMYPLLVPRNVTPHIGEMKAEMWSVKAGRGNGEEKRTVMEQTAIHNQWPYESGSFMISSSMSFSSCFSVKRCISLPDWWVVSKCWLFSRTLSTCTCVRLVLFGRRDHDAGSLPQACRTRTSSSISSDWRPSRRSRCIRMACDPTPWT